MKKTLVILAVLLCAFGAFAARKTLAVNVVPFSVNFLDPGVEGGKAIVSTLGIGGEVLYKQGLMNNFFVEVGANSSAYKMKGDDKAFSTTLLFLGAGYDIKFTDVFTISTHGGFGIETKVQNKESSERIALKGGATCEFTINKHLGLSVGCDGLYSFDLVDGLYTTYRIIPTVGMMINL